MDLVNRFKDRFRREQLRPSWLSVFINSNFLFRRELYGGIKSLSVFMKGKLLDFGCGNKPYEDLFKVNDYIGIELRDNKGHNNDLSKVDVFYNGEEIPFSDHFFDSIFCSEVFEHVFNLEAVLSELTRVLKPEGKILITIPFFWQEHEQPNDFARYTSYGFVHLLEKHGFRVIKKIKTMNYVLVFFQTINAYLYYSLSPKNSFLKLFFTVIFISPVNVLALFFNWLLPQNKDLFGSLIILAQKNSKLHSQSE